MTRGVRHKCGEGAAFCQRCQREKPRDAFGRNAARHDGLSHYCHECVREWRAPHSKAYAARWDSINSEKRRRYQQSPAGRANARRRVAHWKARNPQKARAHTAVKDAIRAGKMTRQPCSICRAPYAEAHHFDYTRPFDVIWLCPAHHEAHHHGRKYKTHTTAPHTIPGWVTFTLYNGQVKLGFDKDGRATGFRHSYWLQVPKCAKFPQGRRLIWGVTGISGLLTEAASGLSPWAARQAVKYLREVAGLKISDEQADEAVRAHVAYRDKCAVNGTAVHKAVEDIIAGVAPPAKPSASYKRGAEIVELLQRERFKVMASESRVFSRKHEYCGTTDLDVARDNERAIIDVKTSKAFRLPHAFQIAAYAKAREEELGVKYTDVGVICASGKPRLYWLSDAMKMPGPQAIAACFNAFLGLLAVKSSIPNYQNFGRDH